MIIFSKCINSTNSSSWGNFKFFDKQIYVNIYFMLLFFGRKCFAKLFSVTFWLCNFLAKEYRQKTTWKILMKLTPGVFFLLWGRKFNLCRFRTFRFQPTAILYWGLLIILDHPYSTFFGSSFFILNRSDAPNY